MSAARKIVEVPELTFKLNTTNKTRPVIAANGTTIELANDTRAEILAKKVTGETTENGDSNTAHLTGDLLLIVLKDAEKREVLLQVRATEMTITWVPFSGLSIVPIPE